MILPCWNNSTVPAAAPKTWKTIEVVKFISSYPQGLFQFLLGKSVKINDLTNSGYVKHIFDWVQQQIKIKINSFGKSRDKKWSGLLN